MAQKLSVLATFERCFFERFGSSGRRFSEGQRELMDFFVPSYSLWPTSIPDTTKRFIHRRKKSSFSSTPIPDQRPHPVDRPCAVELCFWVAFGAAVWDFDPDLPDIQLANPRPPFPPASRSGMRTFKSAVPFFNGPRNSLGHLSSETAQ